MDFKISLNLAFLSASFLQRKRALVKYFLSRSELSLAFTSGKLSRELLSRGGAPIILDPRKGISFLFKERISLSLWPWISHPYRKRNSFSL